MWTYLVLYLVKMRVLEWPLSRQWDCSQHGYKFDKYEGW